MEQPSVLHRPDIPPIAQKYTNACETVSIFLHFNTSICVKMTLSMSETDNRSNNIAILYVEDNADNRLLVRRILSAEGFCLLEASGAQQALAYLDDRVVGAGEVLLRAVRNRAPLVLHHGDVLQRERLDAAHGEVAFERPEQGSADPRARPQRLQAGAGIVADSVPEKEYLETVNKAMGMMKAVDMAEKELR